MKRPLFSWLVSIGALLLGVTLVYPTHAADDKKADREARRAELLQQRLQQEESAWDAERADLQKKIADAQAETASAKATESKTGDALTKAESERKKLETQLHAANAALEEANRIAEKKASDEDKELTDFRAARERERVAQHNVQSAQAAALAACTDKNQKLLELSHGLLERYRNKDVKDALLQEDPVLGFKNVQLFNEVQDFGNKIDEQAYTPAKNSP